MNIKITMRNIIVLPTLMGMSCTNINEKIINNTSKDKKTKCFCCLKGKFKKMPSLHQVVAKGHLEIVLKMIKEGTNINEKNMCNETSLQLAIRSGHLNIAKILVKHGANVNDKDEDGRAPLNLASVNGYLEITSLLIKYGAT